MDGETNGSQEATQGAQDRAQQQGQEQQETQQSQSRPRGAFGDRPALCARRLTIGSSVSSWRLDWWGDTNAVGVL